MEILEYELYEKDNPLTIDSICEKRLGGREEKKRTTRNKTTKIYVVIAK